LFGAASETTTAADFCLSLSSMAYFPLGRISARTAASAFPYWDCWVHRWRDATTSSDVISLPLWNLTPWRSRIT
jgi:hypothetical protein